MSRVVEPRGCPTPGACSCPPTSSNVMRTGFQADVPVIRQFGPHDFRRVGIPCMVGVTLDTGKLLAKLGEKALKSKGKRATAFYGALIIEVKELGE